MTGMWARLSALASEDVCLSEILGTEKGISALVEFLKVSGALTRDGMEHKPPKEPEYKPWSFWDDLDNTINTQIAEGGLAEADWRDKIVDSDDFEIEN
ncbi:hypothetical protein BT96DRAFT_1007052 [Gymnopus androsaceus JB14]|uniref:Uncharacterized protein n=1 Tax=Gymnopus androsaceus JB14 TaxID=1447944 RepID=A0A6A4GIU6_9AGAR|nr:hypothetical protein BT96DRAFT_1007052 [Gymnopus androsaceus JB14]